MISLFSLQVKKTIKMKTKVIHDNKEINIGQKGRLIPKNWKTEHKDVFTKKMFFTFLL
jgi:hypothetical protein